MRRQHAVRVALLAVIVGLATAGTLGVRDLLHPCRDLGRLDDYAENTMTRIECIPGFVSRSGGIVVFLDFTTHLPGEEVTWNAQRRVFFYDGHGETYDVRGWPVAGPTLGPMKRCPVRLEGQDLVLDVPESTPEDEIDEHCVSPERPSDLVLDVPRG